MLGDISSFSNAWWQQTENFLIIKNMEYPICFFFKWNAFEKHKFKFEVPYQQAVQNEDIIVLRKNDFHKL